MASQTFSWIHSRRLGITLPQLVLCIILAFVIVQVVFHFARQSNRSATSLDDFYYQHLSVDDVFVSSEDSDCDPRMELVTVACGRMEEALTLLKSIVLFTQCPMVLNVFVNPNDTENARKYFQTYLDAETYRRQQVQLRILQAVYPNKNASDDQMWKSMYAPCSSLRLFLPYLLPDTDAIIFLDSDVLVVSPIEQFWKEFESMVALPKMVGFVPEFQHVDVAWYGGIYTLPFPLPFGFNAGIGLMNLTRMRAASWEKQFEGAFKAYEEYIRLADQDIMNILLHYKYEYLHLLPCSYNFRLIAKHCDVEHGYHCPSAERAGSPRILHGNGRAMQQANKQLYYSLYYKIFSQLSNSPDGVEELIEPLEKALAARSTDEPGCRLLERPMLEKFKRLLQKRQHGSDGLLSLPSLVSPSELSNSNT